MQHNKKSAPSLFTVTRRGVVSCTCRMTFQWCSTIKSQTSLLQVGKFALRPQMFRVTFKPQKLINGL